MNQAHIHLVINHLPIFGSFLGFLVLAYGMLSKSKHTIIAAYFIFIISAIGATFAYYTGEGAEEVVEKIKEVSETMIKQHESFAIYALIGFVIFGLISVIAIIMTTFYLHFSKVIAFMMLFLSLICLGLSGWTGYLGGKIRHTELDTNTIIREVHTEKDID